MSTRLSAACRSYGSGGMVLQVLRAVRVQNKINYYAHSNAANIAIVLLYSTY